MPTATITRNVSVGGMSLPSSISRTEEGLIAHEITLAAGVAGAITAGQIGVDGLAGGHGIVGTNIVDIHWDDPTTGLHKVRYGATVDTANANDIEFDNNPAEEGDALPAEDVAVVVCVQQVIDTDVDLNNAKLVAVHCGQRAHCAFTNDDPATQKGLKIAADTTFIWNEGEGIDNPFIADADDLLDEINVSNGSIVEATLQIGILYDSA